MCLLKAFFYPLNAQAPIKPAVSDFLIASESVKMNGHIGKMLDLSYESRILTQDVQHLIKPFQNRTESSLWQSEFWGKWFTSAVLAYKYRPEPPLKEMLKTAVESLIATQTPDGYIGNYKADKHLEQWDIWGRKYTMLGLLQYHDLTQDKKSLTAAVKLADHLIKEINAADGKIINKGNHKGMAASSVLEPIVMLYRQTNDTKYLDFAKKIVQQWEYPDGPQLISKSTVDVSKRFPKPKQNAWYGKDQGQKAYEMMSCYEGLLELYRITGDISYKKAVEATWQNIKDKEINIAGSGASVEMWFGGKALQTLPIRHFQETCVTVTWIKLNQQLLRLTGEAKYADEIEKSYYNALLASLSKDGSEWAKYTPLNGQRLPGSGQCGMDINCCDASGPRGLFTLPLTSVMATKKGVSVNFFVDGTYHLKSPEGKHLKLIQKTDYPLSGHVEMSIDVSEKEQMTLRVRIPAWSKNTQVKVNGETITGIESGKFVEISRIWSPNDLVSLDLDMTGRLEKHGQTQKIMALLRGPIVLARDSYLSGTHLEDNLEPVINKNGYINLMPVAEKKKAFGYNIKLFLYLNRLRKARLTRSPSIFVIIPQPAMLLQDQHLKCGCLYFSILRPIDFIAIKNKWAFSSIMIKKPILY